MSGPVFTNKDAEWLYRHSQSLIEAGDYDRGLRLSQIATRLQSIDDKLLALSSSGDAFAAGVREAYTRVYERSNLPEESRTMPKAAAAVLGLDKPVRRIPMGISGAQETAKKVKATKQKPATAARLAGVKLNLSALKLGGIK